MDQPPSRPLAIAAVNALDRAAFTSAFAEIFEASPWVAERAWAARPFADRAALHAAMCSVVRQADRANQLALIRAHPDLVGAAARRGTLTRSSRGEQAAAGLDPGALSPTEIAAFEDGNRRYRERYGMPFVICARDNPKDAILAAFPVRLANDHETEIAAALREIERITHHRLVDAVSDAPPPLPGKGGSA